MPQKQGVSSSSGGRLDGSLGSAVVDTDFVLGAGWGASTWAVTAGSTDQRGEVVITGVTGGGLAQATATIVFTYRDGLFQGGKPWFEVTCTNTNSLTALHAFTVSQAATTTTASTWTSQIIPVNAAVYTVRWKACQ